jgi:hypothetical protein
MARAATDESASDGAPRVTFRARLVQERKTATGIEVPPELIEQLGAGKKPPVLVSFAGHRYPTTIGVMGGRFLVPVSAANRTAAGVAAGDELDVELVLDQAPRVVEVPADLATALEAEPEAKAFFEGLTPSQKKWHVLQVTGAKTDETRQRRVAKSIELLAAGTAR